MDNITNLLSMTLEEIQNEIEGMGEKAFRGKQIFRWLHQGILDFNLMTDLPQSLREKLASRFDTGAIKILKKLHSADGATTKYLFLLHDNNIIESVLMKYTYGNTICISTQVGCRMGCSFCASSLDGLIRNLSAGEILAQVVGINCDVKSDHEERAIDNIVLMGSGEPLDNYENTLNFLKLVNHPMGINMSYRNITISTCGIISRIEQLAQEKIPVTLSISLHAPNDRIRKEIMPVTSAYSLSGIIQAGRNYYKESGRRVTFEYALIDGVNDRKEHADELAARLEAFPCHVNIIPVNEVKGTKYHRSDETAVRKFIETLKNKGISVTRRRELGLDIDGACGQLRRGYSSRE